MSDLEYVPGVCNIGPAEIKRRRMFGWVSAVIGIVLFVVLVRARVNPWWRLFMFLPGTGAASGFLQAQMHFCSGFARAGVYNFGAPGTTQHVTDDASRQLDRRRGGRIGLYAVAIGVVVALACVAMR